MQPEDDPTQALLAAAEAALAWADARERQASAAELTQLYERWVQLMRLAVARATDPANGALRARPP